MNIYLLYCCMLSHYSYVVTLVSNTFLNLYVVTLVVNDRNLVRLTLSCKTYNCSLLKQLMRLQLGGQSVWHESSHLKITIEAHDTLNHVGWLDYFERIQRFDREVALEFMQNLSEGIMTVKNLQVQVDESNISKVMILVEVGEKWYGMNTSLLNVTIIFKWQRRIGQERRGI